MWNEPLSKQADAHPQISEWLKQHGDSFRTAIGLRGTDDETLILLLAQLYRYAGGDFPVVKGPIDQAAWRVTMGFLDGQPFEDADLRKAVALLWQSFSGACYALAIARKKERENERRYSKSRQTLRPRG